MGTSNSTAAGPVIAHRGACLEYPENTIAAIIGAKEAGCRWVEIDAQVARDRIPVLMHDHSVDRTTDHEGLVGVMTSAEITTMRTRAPRSGALTDQTVPLLTRTLDICLQHDIALVVEIGDLGLGCRRRRHRG